MQPTDPKTPTVTEPVNPATAPNKTTPIASPPTPLASPTEPNRLANTDRLRWIKEHKLWFIIAGAILVVIAAGSYAFLKLRQPKAVQKTPAVAKAPEPPKPILSPTTGLVVTPEVLAQPVFGVVIENSPDARPQSGLGQADVVYETLAEGGITRFLAVFHDQQPTNLGPVRSLRHYFNDWIQEYNNAPVAHAGGSAQALAEVPQLGIKSMNGLTYGSSFRRAGDRYSPHNLYTSTAQLIALMQKSGWVTPATLTPWTYKADAPLATPTNPAVTANFSYPLFSAKYQYNAACNCYDRFLAGAAHIERNTGKQIQVKNVVAIVIQTGYGSKGHALMTTVGSGKAYVFRDGGAVLGTWKKDSRLGRIKFLDTAGAEISLNAGNTWVEAIAQTGSVTY